MKKLYLSLLTLSASLTLIGMEKTAQCTLEELLGNGTLTLQERIKDVTWKRTGKTYRVLYLRELGLTSAQGIGSLPEAIRSQIERIDLSRNNLTEVPEELITHYPHIVGLSLCHNNLGSLPEDIGKLPLIMLTLANNSIQKLPDSCAQLTSLTRLNLSHNCLESFQEDIFKQFGALQWLKLNVRLNNTRRRLDAPDTKPLSIAEKKKALTLFEHQDENVPSFELKMATTGHTLEQLIASGKVTLSQRIKTFTWPRTGKTYRVLDLSKLGLTSIKGIGNLPESERALIDRIDLKHNLLKEIPASLVTDFPNLVGLNISRNDLTTIPEELGLLPLEFLSVSYNSLTKLPASFARLSGLLYLNSGHNCWESFQEDIYKHFTRLELLKINAKTNNPNRWLTTAETVLSPEDKEKVNTLFKERFKAIPNSQLKV